MANKNEIPKVIRDLKKSNYKKKIKIRYKKLPSGSYSLYLDIWHNGKRQYETLKIYINGNRNTKIDDNNKIRIALSYRDQKEKELLEKDTGFTLMSWKTKANFVVYFKSLIDKGIKTHNSWLNAYYYLQKFTDGKIQIQYIDKKFCREFRDYLIKNLSKNTAKTYLAKLKTALNLLVEEEIIPNNPAKYISINSIEVKREFLILEEIKKLHKTKCDDEETKNAFLFSCFTGLRNSDIRLITFNQIENGYLLFRDKKTQNVNRMKLNETALEIIEKQKRIANSDKIFKLKSMPYTEKLIKKWVEKAGIKKHITFHVSRHSFATLCLTHDIDIYTVSKLLGHRDIKSTQIYAKLIDKKKDEAVDKLPKI